MKIKFIKEGLRGSVGSEIYTYLTYEVVIWTEQTATFKGCENRIGELHLRPIEQRGNRFLSVNKFREWYRKGYFKIIKEYDS